MCIDRYDFVELFLHASENICIDLKGKVIQTIC